jgi:hypothetical protein
LFFAIEKLDFLVQPAMNCLGDGLPILWFVAFYPDVDVAGL